MNFIKLLVDLKVKLKIEYLLILAFFISFFLSSNQFLTGTLVNFLIIIASKKFCFKKSIPLLVIPSISTLLRGLIWGKLTRLLVYFIPFIWISNSILFLAQNTVKSKNSLLAFIPALLKSLFLSMIAFLFFKIGQIPKTIFFSMSFMQFITSFFASGIFFVISKSNFKFKVNERY